MTGTTFTNVTFSGGQYLTPAVEVVPSIVVSTHCRGLFTADPRLCTTSGLSEIDSFTNRAALGDTLLPASSKAKLATTSGFGNYSVASFTAAAAPYVHSLSKDWGTFWSLGFIAKSASSAADQYLCAATGLSIRIPGGTSNLVVSYNGTDILTMAITHGTPFVLFAGWPGGKIRAWLNGVQLADVTATSATFSSSVMHFFGDTSNTNGWRGYVADVLIYTRYEPASRAEIPGAFHSYAYAAYQIGAAA